MHSLITVPSVICYSMQSDDSYESENISTYSKYIESYGQSLSQSLHGAMYQSNWDKPSSSSRGLGFPLLSRGINSRDSAEMHHDTAGSQYLGTYNSTEPSHYFDIASYQSSPFSYPNGEDINDGPMDRWEAAKILPSHAG